MKFKYFLFCSGLVALSYASTVGIGAQLGMRFLSFDQLEMINDEFDSNFVVFSANAKLTQPTANIQKVSFQKTKMSFPLGAHFWWQIHPYLRMIGSAEWVNYSDNALMLVDDAASESNYDLKALTVGSGLGIMIPKSLLSLDSARSLRVEVQRLWLPYSRLNWNGMHSYNEFDSRGQGWRMNLAYESSEWRGFLIGLKLGFSSLDAMSDDLSRSFFPTTKPAGKLMWGLGGLEFAFNLSFGSPNVKSSTLDSTQKSDSIAPSASGKIPSKIDSISTPQKESPLQN